MPNTPHTRPPVAGTGRDPRDDGDPDGVFAHWRHLIAAGRIGNPPPTPATIAARRDATAAQFALYARDARRIARGVRP